MNWDDIKAKYGEYISGDPVDSETFSKARLQTFYSDHGHGNRVLSKIPPDIASLLRPLSQGMSDTSGSPRFHVVHEGCLTGKQVKDYLIIVAQEGGEIWEVLL